MRLVTAGHGISILLHSIETDIFESLCRIRRDDVVRFNGRQQEKRSNPSRENSSRARRALASRCFVTLRNSPKEAPGSTGTNVPLASSFIRCTELFGRGVGKGCGRTSEWASSESNPDEAHVVTKPTADLLQELIETLASDMSAELEMALASSADNLNEASSGNMEEDAEEAVSTLPLLLSSLRTIYVGPPMRKVIAKLLPFLTYGQPSLLHELASNFCGSRECRGPVRHGVCRAARFPCFAVIDRYHFCKHVIVC